ncbi:hypothetical protein PoB_002944800 [Plakobranchus ocellatus]|uniref:Uncharacterized protein n=1 Tax=Plakobranchus ocellatus TaxID=259542 RepID=A0AAV4A880_9GAST|nr:hypothetical protein PoB_002944800 [Plakobranchus ocellatus]
MSSTSVWLMTNPGRGIATSILSPLSTERCRKSQHFCLVRAALWENHTWPRAYLVGVVEERDPGARCEQVEHHANLQKRYISRDIASDEISTVDGSVSVANLAVVEEDDEGGGCDGCGCEVLPKLGGWGSKKTVKEM